MSALSLLGIPRRPTHHARRRAGLDPNPPGVVDRRRSVVSSCAATAASTAASRATSQDFDFSSRRGSFSLILAGRLCVMGWVMLTRRGVNWLISSRWGEVWRVDATRWWGQARAKSPEPKSAEPQITLPTYLPTQHRARCRHRPLTPRHPSHVFTTPLSPQCCKFNNTHNFHDHPH